MPSFDVVSEVDTQEILNAVNQARKEVGQRYDFKGSDTVVELDEAEIRIESADDYKVNATVEVLQSKLAKRQVPLKALEYGKVEPAAGGRSKQTIQVQQGISTEKAREIVKIVKGEKLKVQAQVQADQVRISGKSRDVLQQVIELLRERDLSLPLQFVNFRD